MQRRIRSKLSVRQDRCCLSSPSDCNHRNSNLDGDDDFYRLQQTKRLVAQEFKRPNFNNNNNATIPTTNSLSSAMKHAASTGRKEALNFVTIDPSRRCRRTTKRAATGNTTSTSVTTLRLIITTIISVAMTSMLLVSTTTMIPMAFAQTFGAVKGGSLSSSTFNQQQQQTAAVPATSSGLSQTFVQMFNSLTPVQQQQFIRQMSSSNRRIFQQAIQAQPITNSFVEESSSSSSGAGGTGGFSLSNQNLGSTGFSGTKSASFKQNLSNQQVLSPVQSGIFRSQQLKSFTSAAPTIIQQPASQFSFSRQIQQSQQTPQIITTPTSSNEFKSTKTVFNSAVAQPQPQQQSSSFFNRVVQQQQVAQPVVLPTSEQSFRRVQSFSSQPLVTPTEATSGFVSQQYSQQIQPQPVQQSSFNKFQQSSFSQQQQQPQTLGFNQFSSSSSNLAGGTGGFGSSFGIDGSSTGFGSAGLQQEKLDATSGVDLGVTGLQQVVGGTGGISQSNFESSTSTAGAGGLIGGTNSLITAGGFDSTDAQQKNIALPESELYGGLTAASINNKWYIMKPVDNPSALGLGDARAASGSLRQVPLARALAATGGSSSNGPGSSTSTRTSTAAATTGTSTPTSATTSANSSSPKKRSSSSSSATSNRRSLVSEPSAENETDESSNGSGDNETEDSESKRS